MRGDSQLRNCLGKTCLMRDGHDCCLMQEDPAHHWQLWAGGLGCIRKLAYHDPVSNPAQNTSMVSSTSSGMKSVPWCCCVD